MDQKLSRIVLKVAEDLPDIFRSPVKIAHPAGRLYVTACEPGEFFCSIQIEHVYCSIASFTDFEDALQFCVDVQHIDVEQIFERIIKGRAKVADLEAMEEIGQRRRAYSTWIPPKDRFFMVDAVLQEIERDRTALD